MQTTLNDILGHRLAIEQPQKGFRIAVDTVLLAAAVPACPGQSVLELGCGVGGAMLALACRVPDVSIVGIEIQEELARLCEGNIVRNDFWGRLRVRVGDATSLPKDFDGLFDHVLMNPPYHDETRHDASPSDGKRVANMEKGGSLCLWVHSADRALKKSGMLTIIHRADRVDDVCDALRGLFGSVRCKPLLPRDGEKAKRVIVRACKGGAYKMEEEAGLALHLAGGGYTEATEAILRHMAALD